MQEELRSENWYPADIYDCFAVRNGFCDFCFGCFNGVHRWCKEIGDRRWKIGSPNGGRASSPVGDTAAFSEKPPNGSRFSQSAQILSICGLKIRFFLCALGVSVRKIGFSQSFSAKSSTLSHKIACRRSSRSFGISWISSTASFKPSGTR